MVQMGKDKSVGAVHLRVESTKRHRGTPVSGDGVETARNSSGFVCRLAASRATIPASTPHRPLRTGRTRDRATRRDLVLLEPRRREPHPSGWCRRGMVVLAQQEPFDVAAAEGGRARPPDKAHRQPCRGPAATDPRVPRTATVPAAPAPSTTPAATTPPAAPGPATAVPPGVLHRQRRHPGLLRMRSHRVPAVGSPGPGRTHDGTSGTHDRHRAGVDHHGRSRGR